MSNQEPVGPPSLTAKIQAYRKVFLGIVNHPKYKRVQKLVWIGCIIWAGVIMAQSIPYYMFIAQGKTAAIEGRYSEAEDLFLRAVKESEHDDKSDPRLANALNNLGELYIRQGKYEEATPFYSRMLDIADHNLDKKRQEQALLLHNIASFYRNKGDLSKAESLAKRSLSVWEKEVKKLKDPNYAAILTGLARIYKEEGDYKQAEPLYARALEIRIDAQGRNHPDVAAVLCSSGGLYREEAKYKQSEAAYRRTLEIDVKSFGWDHPDTATDETCLAGCLRDMGRLKEAEGLYVKSLNTRQRLLGKMHPDTARSYLGLAELRRAQGNSKVSLGLIQQALAVDKGVYGSQKNPDCADCYNALSITYRKLGDLNEAQKAIESCLKIRTEILPAKHPDIAEALFNQGEIFRLQKNYAAAESCYRRSESIQESVLGKSHPALASTLESMGELYSSMKHDSEAVKCKAQAKLIRENRAAS